MTASSSLSMASAAISIATSPPSLSSSFPDHLPLHFFPRSKPKPLTVKSSLKFNALWCPIRSVVSRVSTAFDGVELTHGEEEDDDVRSSDGGAVSEEEGENLRPQSTDAGRLYVGNLPFSMTSKQLSDIFAEAGRVLSAEIVYDRVTDRSRGFSFVTMGSFEEAKEAIRLFDGAQIGGRTSKVNFPEVPRGGEREVMAPKIRSSYQGFVDSPHKIYAGNLSWELTSQGLRNAFEDQPGFLSAKIIYDRDSGRSRGFGFVTFSSEQEVESALNCMNGTEVGGRPLRLNLAEQRASVSSPSTGKQSSESDTENSEILSN